MFLIMQLDSYLNSYPMGAALYQALIVGSLVGLHIMMGLAALRVSRSWAFCVLFLPVIGHLLFIIYHFRRALRPLAFAAGTLCMCCLYILLAQSVNVFIEVCAERMTYGDRERSRYYRQCQERERIRAVSSKTVPICGIIACREQRAPRAQLTNPFFLPWLLLFITGMAIPWHVSKKIRDKPEEDPGSR